jgi:hypothetical protein
MNQNQKTLNTLLNFVGENITNLENKYNTIHCTHAVWVTDLKFNVLWVNHFFLKISGYTEDDFASEKFSDIFKKLNVNHPGGNTYDIVSENLYKEYIGFFLHFFNKLSVQLQNVLTMSGEKKNMTLKFLRLDAEADGTPMFYIVECLFDRYPQRSKEKDLKILSLLQELKSSGSPTQEPQCKKTKSDPLNKIRISNLMDFQDDQESYF